MKIFSLSIIFLLIQIKSVAQNLSINKPAIDSAAIANWADLLWSEPSITPDGRYFMYPIGNLPAGSKTLVIQSTKNDWKKEFIGADKGFFSGDSKLAIFKKGDSLFIQSLCINKLIGVANVSSYKNPKAGNGQWLAYLTKASDLTLYNLSTGKAQQYPNIVEYQFDNSGRALLLKEKIKTDSATSEKVEWITLSTSKAYTVWQTANDKLAASKAFKFDEDGKQLVFIVEDKGKAMPYNTVWYFKEGMKKAIEKVTNETYGIDSGMIVGSSGPSFSKNGKYIFFKIQPIPQPPIKPNLNAVQVDVWSYKDAILNYAQMLDVKKPRIALYGLNNELTTVTSVNDSKIICLEKKGVNNYFFAGPGDFALVGYAKFIGDKIWQKEPPSYFLVSLKLGATTMVTAGNCVNFSFSPSGNYLVYYNIDQKSYYSYNINSGESENISDIIPVQLINENIDIVKENGIPVGVAGWIENNLLLIYDNYDIWKIDPSKSAPPENLSNGYGYKHHVKLRLINDKNLEQEIFYKENDTLLLCGFEVNDKLNSFYSIIPAKKEAPQILYSGPFLFYTNANQTMGGLHSMLPVKARDSNIWLSKRQSVTEAPNFFVTSDFKEFKQLTDIQPQKNFNWFESELLTWMQPDRQICRGIFYKPDNFDPTKKYPVIIDYYEKRSDELHQFLEPEFMGSTEIDKPWFLSRGYLVLSIDINYSIGKTGESVVNSVVSGAKSLFSFPYVDSTRIGIAGHSFGGYETNYLITHSDIFAAAAEGAGASNFISYYGSILPNPINYTMFPHFESGGQYRIDGTPWDKNEEYINNSPIFNIDKVSTPLLIMHNKNDFQVPWSQAVELFIGLRRLNKKVWMLQYDNGGHGISKLLDKVDYTNRLTQFFDHYLKNTPAPIWMTQGIPAQLKGIITNYDYDPVDNCSNDCKICKQWNGKYKDDSTGTLKEIEGRKNLEHWQ